MNKKTILILGSGATVGGKFTINECTPPMDYNFFTSPVTNKIFNKDDYPALYYYQKRFNDESYESTWSRIDLLSKLCCSSVISEQDAYNKLKSQLENKAADDSSSSYKNKLDIESKLPCNTLPSMGGWEFINLITDIYKNIEKPEKTSPLLTLISKIRDSLTAIVTFNFDLALEQIIDNIYYPNFTPENNKLPVYKLHGSLNWQETSATKKINITNAINLKNVAHIEHTLNCYCQPSIIAPTIFKQEINIDFQNDWRAIIYKNLWNMCWHKLQEADNLLFVGFGFPSTDWHIRALLESASTTKDGYKNVIYCHKNNTNNGYDAVKSIFKGANTYEFKDGLEDLIEKNLQCIKSLVE